MGLTYLPREGKGEFPCEPELPWRCGLGSLKHWESQVSRREPWEPELRAWG